MTALDTARAFLRGHRPFGPEHALRRLDRDAVYGTAKFLRGYFSEEAKVQIRSAITSHGRKWMQGNKAWAHTILEALAAAGYDHAFLGTHGDEQTIRNLVEIAVARTDEVLADAHFVRGVAYGIHEVTRANQLDEHVWRCDGCQAAHAYVGRLLQGAAGLDPSAMVKIPEPPIPTATTPPQRGSAETD